MTKNSVEKLKLWVKIPLNEAYHQESLATPSNSFKIKIKYEGKRKEFEKKVGN